MRARLPPAGVGLGIPGCWWGALEDSRGMGLCRLSFCCSSFPAALLKGSAGTNTEQEDGILELLTRSAQSFQDMIRLFPFTKRRWNCVAAGGDVSRFVFAGQLSLCAWKTSTAPVPVLGSMKSCGSSCFLSSLLLSKSSSLAGLEGDGEQLAAASSPFPSEQLSHPAASPGAGPSRQLGSGGRCGATCVLA